MSRYIAVYVTNLRHPAQSDALGEIRNFMGGRSLKHLPCEKDWTVRERGARVPWEAHKESIYTKMCQFPLELAPPIFLADSVAAPLIFFPAISVPIHPLSDDDSVRLEASSEEEVGGFGARCSFPLKNYRSATVTMKIIKSNTKSHYCLSCFAQCCSLR